MALAIAGLRAGVRPEADPIGAAGPTVAPRPSHSGAPYDYLPGRTRIPDPQPVDGAPGEVGGVLPVTGPESGQGTALDAVTMVLGYYCRRSGSGERRITAVDDGYRNLEVVAVNRQRPAITLRLHWTGKAYEWKAIKGELLSCP
jgi:hypothetical protein